MEPAQSAAKAGRLSAAINPADLRSRSVGGGRNALYLTGETVLSLANDILGYDGWSSEIKCLKVDKAHKSAHGKWTIGVMAHMRVTLKEGNFHEDIGYGTAENMPSWTAALEKAKKSAVTDARKRTLRLFGDGLGNCVSNADFQSRARQVQAQSTHSAATTATVERFDAASLMAAPSSRSAPLHTATAQGVGAPGFVLPGATGGAGGQPAASAVAPTAATVPSTSVPSAPVGGAKRAPSATAATDAAASAAKRQATTTATATAAAHGDEGTVLLPSDTAAPLAADAPDGNVSLSQEALRAVEAAEVERRRRIEENKRLALQRRQALGATPVNTAAHSAPGKPASLNSSAGSIGSGQGGAGVTASPGSPEV